MSCPSNESEVPRRIEEETGMVGFCIVRPAFSGEMFFFNKSENFPEKSSFHLEEKKMSLLRAL